MSNIFHQRRNIADLSSYGIRSPQPAVEIKYAEQQNSHHNIIGAESSSEEEITLGFIIKKKPSTKIVREFMRSNLDTIESEEQRLFG